MTPDKRESLIKLVQKLDSDSTVVFLTANDDFNNSLRGGWKVSVYYRLMLPALLPNLDSIIYADTDVIFVRNLAEAADIDLQENLIAGTREKKDYINSGFLIFNLKQMRAEKVYRKMIKASCENNFPYPDQDLLNQVCGGRILYLPWKYNVLANQIWKQAEIHSAMERKEVCRKAVMVHYAGHPKPWWHNAGFPLSKLWNEYANI
jgi:lipopolysaccharide biosynthesis glycosyltransferase